MHGVVRSVEQITSKEGQVLYVVRGSGDENKQ